MKNLTEDQVRLQYDNLTKLDRRSAILARGYINYFTSDAEDAHKLKSCQMASNAFAASVGSPVKGFSLVAKVGALMRDAGVFLRFDGRKPKRGEGYILEEGPHFDEFVEFLDMNPDWGARIKGSMEEDVMKETILDELERKGAVRADLFEHRIPAKGYKALTEGLADNRFDVIYVEKGTIVAVQTEGSDKFKKIGYFIK